MASTPEIAVSLQNEKWIKRRLCGSAVVGGRFSSASNRLFRPA